VQKSVKFIFLPIFDRRDPIQSHHDWSDTLEGTGSQILAGARHNEIMGKIWTNLLADCSNKSFDWWHSRSKKAADFYFSSDDAIEWGLADQIWVEK